MKLKISQKQLFLVVIGLTAVLAVTGFTLWGPGAKAEEFMTAKVERGNIRNTVSATGTLQAVTTVQVGSQVSGVISALYADFNREQGITLVLVTHEPDIAEYAGRVIVFKDGRIQRDDLVTEPRDAAAELKLLPLED